LMACLFFISLIHVYMKVINLFNQLLNDTDT